MIGPDKFGNDTYVKTDFPATHKDARRHAGPDPLHEQSWELRVSPKRGMNFDLWVTHLADKTPGKKERSKYTRKKGKRK